MLLPFTLSGCCRVGALLVLAALATTGCSRQTRHDLLTFFFTGVPALEDERGAAEVKGAAKDGHRQQQRKPDRGSRQNMPVLKDGLPLSPPQPQYFSHTVWAEGNCNACHQGNSLFMFQPGKESDRGQTTRVFFRGGGMPGPLLAGKDKLCSSCHTDKTGLRAIKDQLWLHNPTAKGDCLACHDAHQSKYSGVLHKPADQICLPCHPADKLAGLPMHRQGNEPCLSCHNPHMGKDRRLLKLEYQEVKQPARRER